MLINVNFYKVNRNLKKTKNFHLILTLFMFILDFYNLSLIILFTLRTKIKYALGFRNKNHVKVFGVI